MTTIAEPRVNADIIPAVQEIGDTPEKVLFIGQMLTGSATPGTLVENIGVEGEEDSLFGANSFIAGMIRAARKINVDTQFDAIPLDDNGAGVAATATLAFTGPASEDGTLFISVGSMVNYQFELDITSGDSATTIAEALEALIDANTDIPVSASSSTGTLTLTCRHKGTTGNKIGIRIQGTVAGVGCTLTGFASGATDPVLTTLFDVIADLRYQNIVWPGAYSKTTVINFLDGRFNAENDVLDGIAITGVTDSLANHLTALASLNSKSLDYFCNETVNTSIYKGSCLFELNDEISSQVAAVKALRLTDGADISRYVVSAAGALDQFGGMALASLPYANTPMFNLPLIDTGLGFLFSEINQLNDAGGSVIGNNRAGNTVVLGRLLTTYKTDSAGNPDTSFQYDNYVTTASVCREFMYNNLRAKFAQCRLTSGALEQGRAMANAASIAGETVSLYDSLSDLALVQGGDTALKFFKNNLTVTLDIANGSTTILMVLPIVVQLRRMNVVMRLVFENLSS